MDYEEAIERIHAFQVFGSRLGLERMEKLLELLGNPHENMKIIHVAGTNGKGSVCRYIYSILEENGYRVGAYFSPYLENFTERIEFHGKEISREDLAKYTEIALGAVERMVREGCESPTEFELVTAVGLLYFAARQADFVILEVGLGGRGDSTNICRRPAVTAITSISYDHMGQLGDTLERIAWEKAGIIKEGVPVVVSVEDSGAFDVIQSIAEELHAPLLDASRVRVSGVLPSLEGYRFDAEAEAGLAGLLEACSSCGECRSCGAAGGPKRAEEKTVETESQTAAGKDGLLRWSGVQLSMHGRHQISNAVCALLMAETLRRSGVRMSDEAVLLGMKKAKQEGRFEIMRRDPYLILDGAHNPAGAKALAETVNSHFSGRRILLCTGILRDKACEEIVREWDALDADVLVTEVPNPRRMEARRLADLFCGMERYRTGRRRAEVIEDYERAFDYAESRRDEYDLILWAGSLYLIGEVRRKITCLEQSKERVKKEMRR